MLDEKNLQKKIKWNNNNNNNNNNLNLESVLFLAIQLSVCTVSMSKALLFQVIQFSISTQFSSIWPIDRTLSGATTPGYSGSDGNKKLLGISVRILHP